MTMDDKLGGDFSSTRPDRPISDADEARHAETAYTAALKLTQTAIDTGRTGELADVLGAMGLLGGPVRESGQCECGAPRLPHRRAQQLHEQSPKHLAGVTG